jgi:hypothetical protein
MAVEGAVIWTGPHIKEIIDRLVPLGWLMRKVHATLSVLFDVLVQLDVKDCSVNAPQGFSV